MMYKKTVTFIFDNLCEYYPSMCHYLTSYDDVLSHTHFGTTVSKIIDGVEQEMDEYGRIDVQSIKLPEDSSPDHEADMNGISDSEKMKAKRLRLSQTSTSFMNVKFIPKSSCSVKRMFSTTR